MDDHRTFRVQFTLRALLALILVIACSLGAGIWFGVQAALAVIALGLTGYAVIRGGPRAIASPNGLTWLSALLILFSGFYVSGYVWWIEMRLFQFLPRLFTDADPLSLALIWLESLSLLGFGLLAGTLAFTGMAFHAPWRWRRLASSAFLASNAAISGLTWPLLRPLSEFPLIVFVISVLGTVLMFVLGQLRMAESRRAALADSLAVVSVVPTHLPFFKTVTIPAADGTGAWMLIAGSLGLIAANIWLWFKRDPDTQAAIGPSDM